MKFRDKGSLNLPHYFSRIFAPSTKLKTNAKQQHNHKTNAIDKFLQQPFNNFQQAPKIKIENCFFNSTVSSLPVLKCCSVSQLPQLVLHYVQITKWNSSFQQM